MILALVGAAGGWAGLGVGGFYGWMSWVYSYNREAWMTDTQVQQNHEYQYDNMQISTHSMCREQIRDRTAAIVTKLTNYILVTTLVVSLAAEMLVEGQLPKDCADFVLNVYMLCLGSAILYLVLSILFGITASNAIYESTADILTHRVPPPWPSIDTKMKNKDQELTHAFEGRPWKDIFMPPLFRRQPISKALSMASRICSVRRSSEASHANGIADSSTGSTRSPESSEESDCGELGRIEADYYVKQKEREVMWMPLINHSRKCVALGLRNLLEAYGYFCMATLYGEYGCAWAFWAVQIIFTSLNVLITQSMFMSSWHGILIATGPLCCAIAATTSFVWIDRILVPLCYISHCILAHQFSMHDVGERQQDKSAPQAAEAQDSLTPVSPVFEELPVQGLLCEISAPERHRRLAQSSSADTEFGESAWTPMSAVRTSSPSSPSPRRPAVRHGRRSRKGKHKQSKVAERSVRWMMFYGRAVVRFLWALSVCWAIFKAVFGNGFKNSKALLKEEAFRQAPKGPPVAGVSVLQTVWPSPYFRPHALVCPRERVFLADQFRVFELSRDRMSVVPFPCDVNGTIADIAADCNEQGCWPVVLLDGDPPAVFDCSTGRTSSLLQAHASAERFSTRGQTTLFASHHGRVIQYEWSWRRGGWAPLWTVADASRDFQAMDVVNRRLLIFRDQGTVEAQDLDTGARCGVWELPPGVLGAGCAVKGGSSVFLLVSKGGGTRGAAVNLMRADLKGPQGCGPDAHTE